MIINLSFTAGDSCFKNDQLLFSDLMILLNQKDYLSFYLQPYVTIIQSNPSFYFG